MTDELYRVLLNQLTGGAVGAEAQASMPELVAQMVGSDPRQQWMKQYLAQRQTLPQEAHMPVLQEAERGQAQAMRRLRQVTLELQELRERNDTLAAALGACYLCWGEDSACSHCRGRGRPGYTIPDKELFIEWVAPAVRTLKTHSGTLKSSPTTV